MSTIALILLSALALVAVAGIIPAGSGARPLVAAHRGGALLWPENSLLAFRNAIGLGADLLETDVHLTADGEVVVLHDPTLDRTTTGKGALRDVKLADLAALTLRARDGAATAEPVPTLAQLLDLLAPSRSGLLLEIKVGPDRQRYAGIEEKVLALLRARTLTGRVIVMAFESPTLRRIRELDPAIRTTLLVSKGRVDRERATGADVARWAQDVGATELGIDHRAVDASVVEAARKAGLRVATWTVNEEADLRRVIGLGVDVVISDRPDRALRPASQ